MFKSLYKRFKAITFFERLLLVIGIAIGIFGFSIIKRIYEIDPVISWSFVMSIFLWFILFFFVILTDSGESMKEELSEILKKHIEETRLMRNEVKLLTAALKKKKK